MEIPKYGLLDTDVWIAPAKPIIKNFAEYSQHPNKLNFLAQAPILKIIAGVLTGVIAQLVLSDSNEKLLLPILESEINLRTIISVLPSCVLFLLAFMGAERNTKNGTNVFVRKNYQEQKNTENDKKD